MERSRARALGSTGTRGARRRDAHGRRSERRRFRERRNRLRSDLSYGGGDHAGRQLGDVSPNERRRNAERDRRGGAGGRAIAATEQRRRVRREGSLSDRRNRGIG